MKRVIASVTERGQVTIPAEVRRVLGAKARGKIVFEIEGSEVRILPAAMTLEAAFGSVPPLKGPEDFREMERAAKDERAARLVRALSSS